LKFGGFQKTSLIDFPGRISSILFTVGCNLRCPSCHNWRLIVNPKPPFLSDEDALKVLESRRRFVTAVVLTGGEPAMNEDLPDFVERLKQRGFSLKLDTNGFFPQTLERSLPFIDYVAVDVKTSLEKYKLMGAKETSSLLKTIELLKRGVVDYEFRTTLVPGFVDEEDIPKIGGIVKGARRFAFQQFLPRDTLDASLRKTEPYPYEVAARFAETMKRYVNQVVLRI